LTEKAFSLAKDLNITGLKCSSVVLENFKTRFNLRSRKICCKANEVSTEDVKCAKNSVKAFTSGFLPEKIFNMDETALFYALSPNKTLACKSVCGTKLSKKRITIAFCANSTGSIKLKQFVI
jgi:hypothetical protein